MADEPETMCAAPADCEAMDSLVDLLVAMRSHQQKTRSEMPLRKLCSRCRGVIDTLFKRRLAAKIDLQQGAPQ